MANYFPFINLNNGDYELSLAIFETYHNDTERERIEQQILFRQRRRGNYNSQGFVQSARHKWILKRAILRKRPHHDAFESVDVMHGDNNNNNNDTDDNNGKGGEYPITRKLQHNEMRD